MADNSQFENDIHDCKDYSEEQEDIQPNSLDHDNRVKGSPEPPAGWNPDERGFRDEQQVDSQQSSNNFPMVGFIGKTMIQLGEQESVAFVSARKFITASQIAAVVSLIFGGMLLSTVAIVLAIMGYRKLSAIADMMNADPIVKAALKRSGILAIAMGVLALVINAVAVVMLYPALMQAMQQGDFSGLFGGVQQGSTSTGPTTGTSLFG